MKLRLLYAILFLYTTAVVATEKSKDYIDPYDEDDKVILWKGLFTKLNTILLETDRISKQLLDMDKRLGEQGLQITKLNEASESNKSYLNEIRLEFKESQDDLVSKIAKLVVSDANTKYLTEIRLESNNRQQDVASSQVVKLAENVNSTLKLVSESRLMLGNQGENIMQLMDAVDFNKKFLNDTRSEYNKRLEDISKKQDDQADVMKSLKLKANTWTTILRRQDGSVDFNRPWADYQKGFGNPPYGEFFIGLDRLHDMTTNDPHELMVILKDWNNETRYAHYDHFRIGGEDEGYVLKILGNYNGDAGDSLIHHKGAKFTTMDKDNDENGGNCAVVHAGAWWFRSCFISYLNGPYRKANQSTKTGVNWYHWKNDYYYPLQYAEMKIRPKSL